MMPVLYCLCLQHYVHYDEMKAVPLTGCNTDSPRCGHCVKLAPDYAKTAKLMKESGSSVKLAKLDAKLYTELADKFDVHRFPTMKLFLGGRGDSPINFEGDRTVAFLVRWLQKKTSGSPAMMVKTSDEVWDMANKNELVAVGFFKVL